MSGNISVCYVIFEITDQNQPAGSSKMPKEKDDKREARELTIETFSRSNEQVGLLERTKTVSESSKSDDRKRNDSADSISFSSGNPYVETTRGVIHLYKENSLEDGSNRCCIVCILAVPATMSCNDLLTFTAACHDDIKHVRIIKDATPNQYMALLTFRSQQMAREFYKSFNGIPFNSLEPEQVCNIVFVSGVEIQAEGSVQPPAAHTELPTCPVCLERMDESVDGVLTIICNHSFHSNCLVKWGDTSCPVCRHFQTPEVTAENRCLQCFSEENLWICLICGHVGCGRYVEGHAYKHYLATQHCYSMQLGSNRVWDYAGDNFVHRLLQNKGDGKLVEGEQKDQELDDKIDSMQLEWTYHLTSQLEKQKEFFEEKLSTLQQSLSTETSDLRQKLLKMVATNKELEKTLKEREHEKVALEKKVAALTARLSNTLSQLQDEREMAKSLQMNQTEWQEKYNRFSVDFQKTVSAKDQELTELKDQLRDVMFYLEAQKKVEESDIRSELVEGQIVVGTPSKPETSRTRRRKR